VRILIVMMLTALFGLLGRQITFLISYLFDTMKIISKFWSEARLILDSKLSSLRQLLKDHNESDTCLKDVLLLLLVSGEVHNVFFKLFSGILKNRRLY
jgi:hypothetical protein